MKRLIFIFFISISFNCFGQLSTTFSMGGIALDGSYSSFSGPLLLQNDKSCLQVNNGVIIFTSSARGAAFFDPICSIPNFASTPLFSLTPNPAHGITRLFCTAGILSAEDNISVFIYDLSGRMLKQYFCRGVHLKTGFPLQLSNISAGSYVIKVVYDKASSADPSMSVGLKLINTYN